MMDPSVPKHEYLSKEMLDMLLLSDEDGYEPPQCLTQLHALLTAASNLTLSGMDGASPLQASGQLSVGEWNFDTFKRAAKREKNGRFNRLDEYENNELSWHDVPTMLPVLPEIMRLYVQVMNKDFYTAIGVDVNTIPIVEAESMFMHVMNYIVLYSYFQAVDWGESYNNMDGMIGYNHFVRSDNSSVGIPKDHPGIEYLMKVTVPFLESVCAEALCRRFGVSPGTRRLVTIVSYLADFKKRENATIAYFKRKADKAETEELISQYNNTANALQALQVVSRVVVDWCKYVLNHFVTQMDKLQEWNKNQTLVAADAISGNLYKWVHNTTATNVARRNAILEWKNETENGRNVEAQQSTFTEIVGDNFDEVSYTHLLQCLDLFKSCKPSFDSVDRLVRDAKANVLATFEFVKVVKQILDANKSASTAAMVSLLMYYDDRNPVLFFSQPGKTMSHKTANMKDMEQIFLANVFCRVTATAIPAVDKNYESDKSRMAATNAFKNLKLGEYIVAPAVVDQLQQAFNKMSLDAQRLYANMSEIEEHPLSYTNVFGGQNWEEADAKTKIDQTKDALQQVIFGGRVGVNEHTFMSYLCSPLETRLMYTCLNNSITPKRNALWRDETSGLVHGLHMMIAAANGFFYARYDEESGWIKTTLKTATVPPEATEDVVTEKYTGRDGKSYERFKYRIKGALRDLFKETNVWTHHVHESMLPGFCGRVWWEVKKEDIRNRMTSWYILHGPDRDDSKHWNSADWKEYNDRRDEQIYGLVIPQLREAARNDVGNEVASHGTFFEHLRLNSPKIDAEYKKFSDQIQQKKDACNHVIVLQELLIPPLTDKGREEMLTLQLQWVEDVEQYEVTPGPSILTEELWFVDQQKFDTSNGMTRLCVPTLQNMQNIQSYLITHGIGRVDKWGSWAKSVGLNYDELRTQAANSLYYTSPSKFPVASNHSSAHMKFARMQMLRSIQNIFGKEDDVKSILVYGSAVEYSDSGPRLSYNSDIDCKIVQTNNKWTNILETTVDSLSFIDDRCSMTENAVKHMINLISSASASLNGVPTDLKMTFVIYRSKNLRQTPPANKRTDEVHYLQINSVNSYTIDRPVMLCDRTTTNYGNALQMIYMLFEFNHCAMLLHNSPEFINGDEFEEWFIGLSEYDRAQAMRALSEAIGIMAQHHRLGFSLRLGDVNIIDCAFTYPGGKSGLFAQLREEFGDIIALTINTTTALIDNNQNQHNIRRRIAGWLTGLKKVKLGELPNKHDMDSKVDEIVKSSSLVKVKNEVDLFDICIWESIGADFNDAVHNCQDVQPNIYTNFVLLNNVETAKAVAESTISKVEQATTAVTSAEEASNGAMLAVEQSSVVTEDAKGAANAANNAAKETTRLAQKVRENAHKVTKAADETEAAALKFENETDEAQLLIAAQKSKEAVETIKYVNIELNHTLDSTKRVIAKAELAKAELAKAELAKAEQKQEFMTEVESRANYISTELLPKLIAKQKSRQRSASSRSNSCIIALARLTQIEYSIRYGLASDAAEQTEVIEKYNARLTELAPFSIHKGISKLDKLFLRKTKRDINEEISKVNDKLELCYTDKKGHSTLPNEMRLSELETDNPDAPDAPDVK